MVLLAQVALVSSQLAINKQLKELSTSLMLEIMGSGLSILANISLIIPVGTASIVEHSFSQLKMIKTTEFSQILFKGSHLGEPIFLIS